VSKIWYEPQPRQKPIRLPRRRPIKAVPSGIGDQGIVANWLFYYLKGGDHLHDFSPNDNHGTLKNDPAWKDGSYGWALDFDGVDDYVEILDSDSLDVDYITMSFWVNPDVATPDAEQDIIDKWHDVNWQYLFRYYTDGNGDFFLSIGGGFYNVTDITLNADEWQHITCTYDGSEMKVYRNGEQVGSTSVSGTIDHTDSDLWISSNGYEFDGTITLVRIYKVAKSGSWVSRRFERTRGIFGI